MARLRGLGALLSVAALALLAVALVREVRRPGAAAERPVASHPPLREDETSRVEGGFTWVRTREGRVLFQLEADTLVGVEGGAHFVRGVRHLGIYTEDGREVRLEARAARVLRRRARRGKESWELALQGGVAVHDPGGAVLRSDELEWDADAGVLASRGPATVEGDGMRARLARLEYRPGARLVVGHGPVELELGGRDPVRVDADRVVYRLATETIVFDSPLRARRPRGSLLAGSSAVHRDAEGDWTLEAGGPVLLAPHAVRSPWAFAATGLHARRDAAAVDGPGVLAVPGAAAGMGGTLGAARWSWVQEAGGAGMVRTLAAEEDLLGAWRDREGGDWRLAADRLAAEEAVDGHRTIRISGGVRLAGPGELRGEGMELLWDSRRPAEVRLSGAPRARVARGRDVIEAPRFLLDRHSRVLEALDAPITDVHAGSAADDGSGLFAAGTPVRVRSRRVTVPIDGGPLVFEGPLMAWQEDRDLRAGRMTWDPGARRLEAEGDVMVHVVRPRQEGPGTVAGWLRGRRLVYTAATRRAEVNGEAEFRQPGGVTIRADRLQVLLDAQGDVANLVASEGVVLLARDARGTADRLEWTGGERGTIVLSARERLPEIVSGKRGAQRRISAPVIRYDLADGSIAVSGEGGRTRLRGGTGRGTEEGDVDRH